MVDLHALRSLLIYAHREAKDQRLASTACLLELAVAGLESEVLAVTKATSGDETFKNTFADGFSANALH